MEHDHKNVLFPEAVIDKLVGDEVIALYLPDIRPKMSREDVPAVMLEHARQLLKSVGYGSGSEPFVEMGIGLDVARRSTTTRCGGTGRFRTRLRARSD